MVGFWIMKLNLVVIYFDSNSYPNFFLKENLISLKRAQIKLDKDINFLTNESLTNGLFDEKSLEPKENNLNNEAHLFKVIDPTNPELKSTDLSSNNSSNVKDISKKNCNGIFLVAHYKQRGKECSEKSKLFLKKSIISQILIIYKQKYKFISLISCLILLMILTNLASPCDDFFGIFNISFFTPNKYCKARKYEAELKSFSISISKFSSFIIFFV